MTAIFGTFRTSLFLFSTYWSCVTRGAVAPQMLRISFHVPFAFSLVGTEQNGGKFSGNCTISSDFILAVESREDLGVSRIYCTAVTVVFALFLRKLDTVRSIFAL